MPEAIHPAWEMERRAHSRALTDRDRYREALHQIAAMSTAPALSDEARDVLDRTAVPVAVRALRGES